MVAIVLLERMQRGIEPHRDGRPMKASRGASALPARIAAAVGSAILGLALLFPISGATAGSGTPQFAPKLPAPPSNMPLPTAGVDGGAQDSINWAGYAATGSTFTSVTGVWTVPSAHCPANKSQQAAFWVGIDGYSASDPTVQQIGTDSDCTKGKGKRAGGPSYYAWFQMFPSPNFPLPQSSYPVAPGESITASVSAYGPDDLLRITDIGKWSFSTVQKSSITPSNSSAEWITEAPSSCRGSKCTVLPLSDFGSLGFGGATANGKAVSSFTVERLNMTNKSGKQVKAFPSSLTVGGTAFSVYWLHD